MMRSLSLALVFVLCFSAGAWQNDDDPPPAIQKNGVLNAVSEMPPLFGGGAIAPGSLVLIRGWRLGPPFTTSAVGFPLPEELGGISVEIRQGNISKRAAILSMNVEEIRAILPQDTPLGDAAMVIHRRESASEPYPVRIVKSSIGLLSEQTVGWGLPAVAHNGWPPEVSQRNSLEQSARPGETVTLRATGLGASPFAATEGPRRAALVFEGLTVQVAGKRVRTIRFAGRSECCAGYDELAFDLPPDIPEGCHVPVQVRSGSGIASNFVSLAIMRNGGPCVDVGGWNRLLPAKSSGSGLIQLLHADLLLNLEADATMRYIADAGFAKFVANPVGGLSSNLITFPPPGSCTASERFSKLKNLLTTISPLHEIEGDPLDAGPMLTVHRNGDLRVIARVKDESDYVSILGGSLPIPVPGDRSLFLQPGKYRITANSPASGAIDSDLEIRAAVEWTNRKSIKVVDRSKGVTLRWKPGLRSDLIVITASNLEGESGAAGAAVCVAQAAAGSFTIPPEAMTNIPRSKDGDQVPLNLLSVFEVPGQAPAQPPSGRLEHVASFFSSSSVRTVRFR